MQKYLKVRLAVLCVLAMVVSNIGGLIPGYARAGAIDDGQIVNDLGGAVNSAGEAVSLTADCVDEFGDPVSAQYENLSLPEFSGSLILDDPANPPFNHVKKREGLLGFLFPTEYTYVQASLNGEIIKELKREKVSVDPSSSNASASDATLSDASASNASSTAYSYFYKTGTSSWTKVEKDAAIQFEYMSGTKKTYTYEDDDVLVTATLQKKNALPENVKLRVTPVTAATPGYNYDAYMSAANGGDKLHPSFNAENSLLYDIAFITDKTDENGNIIEGASKEFEPAEGSVKIAMSFKKNQLIKDIKVTDPEKLNVVHLPLNDSVKENYNSTKDATNISEEDISVDSVNSKAVSLDNRNEQVEFNLNSLSLVLLSSFSSAMPTGGNETYTSILGGARYYGIVANIWEQEEAETNAAVKTLVAVSGQSGNDLTNKKTQPWILGEVTNGTFNIKGDVNADVWCRTEDVSKINALGSVKINYTTFPQDVLNSKVDTLMKTPKQSSADLSGKVSFTLSDSRFIKRDGFKYIIDITSLQGGTYYVNIDDVLKDSQYQDSSLILKISTGQRIVLNTTLTSLALHKYDLFIDGNQEGTYPTNGDQEKISESIIWNMPDATAVDIAGSVTGIFLAPKAEVKIGATSGGWLVADHAISGSGEWHSIWQHMDGGYKSDASASLEIKKAVSGSYSGTDLFEFVLKPYQNGSVSGKIPMPDVATASCTKNGTAEFDTILLSSLSDASKTYYYTINEVPGNIKGITYSSKTIYAKVAVSADGLYAEVSYADDVNGTYSDSVKTITNSSSENPTQPETTSPASTTGSTGGGGGGGGTSTTAASTTKAQESSSTVPGETTSPYNGGGGRSPRGSGRVQSLTNIGNGDVPLYGYNPDGTEIPGMEIPRGNLGLPKTGEETTDSAMILLILSLIVGAGAALAGIIRKHSAARG